MFHFVPRIFGFTPPVNKSSLIAKASAIKPTPRPTFRPRLEELTPRILLSSNFYWDPTSGNNVDAVQYINNYPFFVNWDVGSLGSGIHPSSLPSGTGATLIFDGSGYNGNANCNVDTNLSGSIVLQGGYNSTITISDSVTLTEYGYTDNDIGADNFLVAFAGPGAVQNFATGQASMGNFAWQAGGKTTVDGGSVLIGMQSGLNQSTASPVIINSGGLVSIGPKGTGSGTSTFKLTNGSSDINVNVNGKLEFTMPTDTETLVDNTGTAAWINNNGTVTLMNWPGGGTATIAAPLENHATLDASQGGTWRFTRPDAGNNDLYMDAGNIKMAGGVTLSCRDGYTQTGGTLEIADASPNVEYLLTLGGTIANFKGGKIVFDSTSGFGILGLSIATFNGVEIDMRINGTSNGVSDQIFTTGNVTIQGTSKLVVTAVNNVVAGSMLTWTLIKPAMGFTITNDFATIQLPQNVTENLGALPNSWQCES